MNKSNYLPVQIASQLQNSFWVSSNPRLKNSIIGIRLRNELDHPFTNFEYPYQLVINFYSPGMSYFADQTQFRGGVSQDGSLTYEYGWEGMLIDQNTIYWKNDASLWTRTTAPPVTKNNQYNPVAIYNKDVNMTNYLYDKYQKAYGVQPSIPGL
jgi:hypothetical protein